MHDWSALHQRYYCFFPGHVTWKRKLLNHVRSITIIILLLWKESAHVAARQQQPVPVITCRALVVCCIRSYYLVSQPIMTPISLAGPWLLWVALTEIGACRAIDFIKVQGRCAGLPKRLNCSKWTEIPAECLQWWALLNQTIWPLHELRSQHWPVWRHGLQAGVPALRTGPEALSWEFK